MLVRHAAAAIARTTRATDTGVHVERSHRPRVEGIESSVKEKGEETSRSVNNFRLKEETHAARWGLMRGYSGKATKWVDFVKAGSTSRKR